ncbi:hypothetical protein CYMTET_11052 [Cymbomonas tetramitiformis]|uniref:Uncharacterized protein n=1 Tax=Cymbomonas tetramitiformis TaxID=36881 RepID=A0AAE0GNA3_9CHLO|nr:hypothetical protein CYMTET_11052 [Cymbomonas tetramitiformis]
MHDRHGFAGGWAGKLAHAPASIATELTHSAVKASCGMEEGLAVEEWRRQCRVVEAKVEVAVVGGGDGGGGEGGGGEGGKGVEGGGGNGGGNVVVVEAKVRVGACLGEEAGVSWAAMESRGWRPSIHAGWCWWGKVEVQAVVEAGKGGDGGEGGDGVVVRMAVVMVVVEGMVRGKGVVGKGGGGQWRNGDMEEVEDMEEVNTTLAEEDSEDANASAVEVAVAGKYTMEATLTLPLVTPLSDTSEVDTPAEAAIWALNSARKGLGGGGEEGKGGSGGGGLGEEVVGGEGKGGPGEGGLGARTYVPREKPHRSNVQTLLVHTSAACALQASDVGPVSVLREMFLITMVAVPLPLALSAVMYTIGGGGLGSGGGDGGGGGLGGGGDGEEKLVAELEVSGCGSPSWKTMAGTGAVTIACCG